MERIEQAWYTDSSADLYPEEMNSRSVEEGSDIKEKESNITYRAIPVNSFLKATEEILMFADWSTLCMVDIDGVLIKEKITKFPGVCHFVNPTVATEVEDSLKLLISILGEDAVCITTNRNEKVKIAWSSNIIVDTVQDLLERIGFANIKMFTHLNKQIPNTSKRKRSTLVAHYVNYVREEGIDKRLKLCVIQDSDIVTLDRRVFPKEIAKKVQQKIKQDLGRDIGVDILDYVLKA